MKNHLVKCQNASKTAPIKQFVRFLPKNCDIPQDVLDKMRQYQAKFVCGTHSSFLMGENQHFLDCIQYGIEIGHKFGSIDIMSAASGRNGIKKEVFDTVNNLQIQLKINIKNAIGYSLTSDIWSDSVNHNSFLDITVFYVNNRSSKLEHQVLVFK